MRRLAWAALACVCALGSAPVSAAETTKDFAVRVLSSPASMVTGGDALVEVSVPRTVPMQQTTVLLNGSDITSTLQRNDAARTYAGMVSGLRLGANTLFVDSNGRGNGRPTATVTLTNHPVTGPIFSGPQQYPFVCKTQTAGLGFPLVDNQDGVGMRLFQTPGNATTPTIGWSANCSINRVVDFVYRTTAGSFQPLPAGPLPANAATTTTLDGRTVPYVVRRERGTINRFIYSIAILAPPGDPAAAPDTSLWNGRLIYTFDGGVAIGHVQGTPGGGSSLYDVGLSKGYAIVHSSGTRTSTHYNLVLGAETAIMTKERFIEGYGVPTYTVGVGGSGGAIQQYVYGQRHPGVIIDAAIPQYSYPDMVTQTIHVGDCELLEHFMDVTDGANPKWSTWTNRTWLEGMASSATRPEPVSRRTARQHGVRQRLARLDAARAQPVVRHRRLGIGVLRPGRRLAAIKWTHWDDLRNVYGVDADGYAKSPWDNVGVQYGLSARQERERHAGGVPEAERDGRRLEGRQGHGAGGLPVHLGPLRDPGAVRPVEPSQHEAEPGRRRHARRRRDGEHGRGERGLHVGDRLPRSDRHPDHRLAALPRDRARHAQLAPVVRVAQADAELRRRRVEPGDLVHGRAAGGRVRPDAAWRSR